MNEETKHNPELQAILSELLDGMLSEASRQRLNEILRDDPAAQDEYRTLMALHALLHLDLSPGQLQLRPPLVPPIATPLPAIEVNPWTRGAGTIARHWRLAAALMSVAVSLLVVFWSFATFRPAPHMQPSVDVAKSAAQQPSAPEPEGQLPAVAVIGRSSRATWSSANVPMNDGAALPPDAYVLKEGLVQLEFLSGATVVIEAPARFRLVSADQLECGLGKIRAHVPTHAIGFTITTPTYAAIDLGTEFTVQVDDAGESQFQVLEGEVNLRAVREAQAVQAQRLEQGQAFHATAEGDLRVVSARPADFVGGERMLQIADNSLRERYQQWQEFSHEVRQRPNIVFYYGFDDHETWRRILRNEGPVKDKLLDGAIVGCQWTVGRWPGKQALEFKRTTDRVRLNVPGEFDSLTFAAWLRVEGLERWLSSLMLTDGHQPGEVHWQMTDLGQFMLGVKAEPEKSHDFYSPMVIGPKDLGRWVHVACVYNGAEGYVAHYVDGEEVSREAVRIPTKLRIGPAEIGNWQPEDLREYRFRSLNGLVDEFILFGSPLMPDAIHELYEAGKPQS